MNEVNRRRSYDASARLDRARISRLTIIDSAREMFETAGYAATTIAAIARAASVSPESIYKTFGTKSALAKEVFDVVIGGDDEKVTVADRPEAEQIRSSPTAADKLRLYAEQAAVRGARSARIQIAIRDGRHGDSALESLWTVIKDQRLQGVTMFGRHLLTTGELRKGIDLNEVRDVLWTYISVEIYELFVLDRGWSRDAYARWLATALIDSLVREMPD